MGLIDNSADSSAGSSAGNPAEALSGCIRALGTDGFEPALSHWLSLVCGPDNITMLAYFQDRGPEVFFSRASSSRVFEKLNSDYIRGAYLLDPFHQLHVEHAPSGLYRLRDVAPDQFQRNEYFATYYGRTTLIDELAYLACPAPGVSTTVCIGRDATSGRRFSNRDMEAARQVAPIVTALSERHWDGLSSASRDIPEQVPGALRERLLLEKGIPLSPRQSEIAFLILQGHSSVSIGLILGISPQTVKVIRKQLYKKCAISSQAELFALLMPYLSDRSLN